MKEWMNKWMNEWTNEWWNEWTNEWWNEWMNKGMLVLTEIGLFENNFDCDELTDCNKLQFFKNIILLPRSTFFLFFKISNSCFKL